MRRELVAILAASALFLALAPTAAFAQPQAASPPPPKAETESKQVVVIADAAANETADARLRAVVFDAARQHGFSPLRRTDIADVARAAGAVEGGRVSTEVASLGSLRRALGVDLLVRISREWERGSDLGLRVTVIGDRGSESKVVSAPSAEPEPPLKAAIGPLLDKVLGKSPSSGAAGTSGTGAAESAAGASASPGATSGGAGVQWLINPSSAPPAPPQGQKAVARAWKRRGGVRATYEARALLTGVLMPHQGYSSENPVTHTTESGDGTTLGIGGGVGVRVGMLYLPLGDPRLSSGSFTAFRLGLGIDGSVLYARPPTGYTYHVSGGAVTGRDTKYGNRAWLYGVASANLGLHFGIGDYATPTIWRGAVLGIVYSPAFLYRLDIASLTGAGKLNPAGVELDLDLASIEARSDVTAESQIRLSAFLLPRVRSDLPWLLALGLGSAWY